MFCDLGEEERTKLRKKKKEKKGKKKKKKEKKEKKEKKGKKRKKRKKRKKKKKKKKKGKNKIINLIADKSGKQQYTILLTTVHYFNCEGDSHLEKIQRGQEINRGK